MTGAAPREGAACRVLHLITDLRTGGAEMQLARLVEPLPSPSAPEVDLVGVACLRSGGEIGERIARHGVRVWAFGARGLGGFLSASLSLGRILRKERVDVLVAWLYHSMIASALPGVVPAGCRVIWNIRGTMPSERDKRGTRMAVAAARVLVRKADRIVYNSEHARREHEASGFLSGASLVIPNGFERPAPRPLRAKGARPHVVLIARYHPMKDFPTFVGALAHLRTGGLDVTAELVGAGCDWDNVELRTLLEFAGLRDGITLTGMVTSTDEALARADVVVSSSAWGEGFQNVLAEAALAGVAVVSTDVGEARLIVGDDRFVTPPNDAGALAKAISRMLTLSRDEQQAIVTERRDRLAAAFGVDVMRTAYATLCTDVLGSPLPNHRLGS